MSITDALVCAVFVNVPGFVEVTVHPEDGGRFVPPTPYPSVTAPPGGISKVAATDIARAEVPEPSEWDIAHVEAGPIGRVEPHVLEDDYLRIGANVTDLELADDPST